MTWPYRSYLLSPLPFPEPPRGKNLSRPPKGLTTLSLSGPSPAPLISTLVRESRRRLPAQASARHTSVKLGPLLPWAPRPSAPSSETGITGLVIPFVSKTNLVLLFCCDPHRAHQEALPSFSSGSSGRKKMAPSCARHSASGPSLGSPVTGLGLVSLLTGMLGSLATILLIVLPESARAIDCFTCTSLNRSNPGCHDPFHPTDAHYVNNCMVPKEGHIGVFPAQYCVKLNGFSGE